MRASTSRFNSAGKGAEVQYLSCMADRSNSSKRGSSINRRYWTGTSMVAVVRSACAYSSQRRASNLRITRTVPPASSGGRNATMVVFE